jgi:hypothetical protein
MCDTASGKAHGKRGTTSKRETENYNLLALFITRSYNSTERKYTHCFLVTRHRELSFRRMQT